MTPDEEAPTMANETPRPPSLRERKRAMAIDEIKDVAIRQLAAGENTDLSLRAVAREVGVTVQSLYHYFASRDDLLTALVVDAHRALADAVTEAAHAHRGSHPTVRLVEVALAYRAWAVGHRAQFLLIYGTPVPGYRAPDPGPTTGAARRLGEAFVDVVFAGWDAAALARVPTPHTTRNLKVALAAAAALVAPTLPPPAFALFVELWGRLHGLVMLEILGHLPWLGPSAEDFYRTATHRIAADLSALHAEVDAQQPHSDATAAP